MSAIIPTVFLVIGALALLAAIYFTWQSVRAALGDAGLPGRAMDIKVTTAMLNRIANNLSLPQPLRARDSQRHDTFGVIQ